jgi:hypothetical protein
MFRFLTVIYPPADPKTKTAAESWVDAVRLRKAQPADKIPLIIPQLPRLSIPPFLTAGGKS